MFRKIFLLFLMFQMPFSMFGQHTSKPTTKKTAYVMHMVKFGETLTKIAKKYEVAINDILKANPSLTANNLSPEQIIRIPNQQNKKPISDLKSNSKSVSHKVENKVLTQQTITRFHTVEKGQTLYSISKLYNVKPEDIQKWNQLIDNNVKIGSQLKIFVEINTSSNKAENSKNEVVIKTNTKANVDTNIPKLPTFISADTLSNTIEKPETQAVVNETQSDLSKLFKEKTSNLSVKSVRGTGAPMTTTLGVMENVYFAMHKNLPIGTIVKIKNLTNNKVLYAKVIGKLPDTDENKHVILRYSLGVKKGLLLQNGKCYIQIEYPN